MQILVSRFRFLHMERMQTLSDANKKGTAEDVPPQLAPLMRGAWIGKPSANAQKKRRFFQLSSDGSTLRWAWDKYILLYYVEVRLEVISMCMVHLQCLWRSRKVQGIVIYTCRHRSMMKLLQRSPCKWQWSPSCGSGSAAIPSTASGRPAWKSSGSCWNSLPVLWERTHLETALTSSLAPEMSLMACFGLCCWKALHQVVWSSFMCMMGPSCKRHTLWQDIMKDWLCDLGCFQLVSIPAHCLEEYLELDHLVLQL